MKKLKLDLDSLSVESFTAGGGPGARGTIQGRDYTEYTCGTCTVYQQTEPASCGPACQTAAMDGCAYPSTSCGPTETYDQASCHCLYAPTDIRLCGCGGTDDPSGGAQC